jgi:murein DD-endopeptidase MepM/ murein hydrolase activator NlpD
MRTTGKNHWHTPSKRPQHPKAVYAGLAIAATSAAVFAGWLNSNSEANDAAAIAASIEAAPTVAVEQEQLLANLFTNQPVVITAPTPTTAKTQKPNNVTATSAAPKASEPVATPTTEAAPLLWKTLTVKSGDSFSSLMERAGFSTQAWYEVISLGEATKALTQLRVGDQLKVVQEEQRLAALDFQLNTEDTLQIRRQQDELTVSTRSVPVERRTVSAVGKIENAFYLAAQKAKLPDNIIMELADLFAWDINFALDIRYGDSFSVLYEEKYQNDKKIGVGKILAAEFINKGKTFRTVRYTDAGGKTNYYTPDGRSMRRAFLRSPVHFTRISSRFNPNRLHPIYKTKRPHRGVDYAAPRGTPIMSSGDGVVTFAGTKTDYGKVVIIKHGERYSTLYAHMNRIGKGMRRGKRVKQGQTIGTVGSTGWATGPHLHYEFRVDGAHRNPLTVKLPLAQPIENRYRADFEAHAAPMMAWLDALNQTQVALKD